MNGRPNLEIRLRCQISPEQCGRSLWFQNDYEQIKGIKKTIFTEKLEAHLANVYSTELSQNSQSSWIKKSKTNSTAPIPS